MTCGIYSITNKETGKMYIGQSIHIEQRFKEHIRYGNDKSYIDRSIKKHGKDAFDFNIILECDESKLSDEEHKFIKLFGTYQKGYNLTWGGEIAISKHPEIRKKIGDALRGRKHTEESKKKMSKSRKGKCTGKDHPMYGKHHSDETKRKLREFNLGKKLSEEHKQKIREGNKGKKMSVECYKKTIKRLKENHPACGREVPLEEKVMRSKIRNPSSGIFRVNRYKDHTTKQGFIWQYNYYDNKKRKHIRSINLNKLKEKVLKKGMEWIVLDEEKAKANGLI